MKSFFVIPLIRDNMGEPVRLHVSQEGGPSQQPGVTAVVELRHGLGWCILADHPLNPGVSVTHGAQLYAEEVCQSLGLDVTDVVWFELDSDGHFDELRLLDDRAEFAPLLEEGAPPRSATALLARLSRMQRSPSLEALAKIQELEQLWSPKK